MSRVFIFGRNLAMTSTTLTNFSGFEASAEPQIRDAEDPLANVGLLRGSYGAGGSCFGSRCFFWKMMF